MRIANYDVRDQVYESRQSRILRATREDGQAVVLKILSQEYPTPERLARFRREFAMTRSLAMDGVIQVYSLEKYQNSLMIVLEDYGADSLAEGLRRGGRLSLPEFLELAATIAGILERIHAHNIIHKDINPANILRNIETGEVKIIDFGISTELSREELELRSPEVLEGTLPYISPEQTGRMNRTLDYRSDFYSLGVSFYELLLGRRPFDTNDLLEIVHSHIARSPAPPCEEDPEIPEAVSAIVMRLMNKKAEDRYQSAGGLKADLEFCLRSLEENGGAGGIANFTIGAGDVSDRFQISQKLYGRDEEIQSLLEAFDRVSDNATEVTLVAGFSGVGKSSLVHEVYRPITRRRGYFIHGKFDQFKRDIPYASLIQAFRGLVRQLLTESEARIAAWRARLGEALTSNGQIIIDVIPEVELIIGEQAPVPELQPGEAQNRFNLVFKNFVRSFAAREHPLCLFLDDLQWADSPSLALLELFATDVEMGYIFIIGAYRDNEVGAGHPLTATIEAMLSAGAAVNRMTLPPLGREDVHALLSDSLHCDTAAVAPLADLCLEKTAGNPFFLNQFLLSLHEQGWIYFDREERGWAWDPERIRAADATENVVDLMASKIRRLDPETRRVLQLAAAVGNTFDLKTIAVVGEHGRLESAALLEDPLREGLVVPADDDYKLVQYLDESADARYSFLHDRVQQAAYSLIEEQERSSVHLKIGRLLLADSTSDAERAERLFDIVGHLNRAVDAIDSPDERLQLARLNLDAGVRAKRSSAFAPALNYCQNCLGLLDQSDAWQRHYELCFEAHAHAAEAAFLAKHYDEMERLTGIALANAHDVLDQSRIQTTRILAYIAQSKFPEVIEIGRAALRPLGVRLPRKANLLHVAKDLTAARLTVSESKLAALPDMQDPQKKVTLELIVNLIPAAFFAAPLLFPVLVIRLVRLSQQYGKDEVTPHAVVTWGMILCGLVGDIEQGYRFGQMAYQLAYDMNIRVFLARTIYPCVVGVRHWKDHFREALPLLKDVYQIGAETGDHEYAAYAVSYGSIYEFIAGFNLNELRAGMERKDVMLAQLKQFAPRNWNRIYEQLVFNLTERLPEPYNLEGEAYSEKEMLPVHIDANDMHTQFHVYFCKLVAAYYNEKYDVAFANTELAEKNVQTVITFPMAPLFYFYDSLVRLAVCAQPGCEKRRKLLRKVAANQRKMKKWGRHGPGNYLNKYHLVEGERLRILGRHSAALPHLERALSLARESEFVPEEALANEFIGRHWLDRGNAEVGGIYLNRAHHGFRIWGGVGKCDALKRAYPESVRDAERHAQAAPAVRLEETASTETSSGTSSLLDMTALMRASQAISGEIRMDRLLTQVMRTMIENAGAGRGLLIRQAEDDELTVQVEGDADDISIFSDLALSAAVGRGMLPDSIVRYVARTENPVTLDDARQENQFGDDAYIQEREPLSVFCAPIRYQGRTTGLLYLENNLATGSFTPERVKVLQVLSTQLAISLENAGLYESLEHKVKERTSELRETLDRLQTMQSQIIAQEKLASLGMLTAGVAHEIRNPLNFIKNFAEISSGQFVELSEMIAEGWAAGSEPANASDVRETLEMVTQNIQRIGDNSKRAEVIIRSMLEHARTDAGTIAETEIDLLLEECVNIVHGNIFLKQPQCDLQLEKDLNLAGHSVRVDHQAISRVFLNILNNAFYAATESGRRPVVRVSSRLDVEQDEIEIRVRDNGGGISEENIEKIFLPFFTTKPAGNGVGLGLSISYDIIVQQHGGSLDVDSRPGEYTEFIIRLPGRGIEEENANHA
ncbi:MAG: trifunctional serine/threonine-protein kinase/ATP-binding protein/sensor histidine kinase [bacterium]|nr:trifunctional serine/threonine-protein kinase/ATP-binding protein/sensor histidine kinase [bacterium]